MAEDKMSIFSHLHSVWTRLQEVAKELKKENTNWAEVHAQLESSQDFLALALTISSSMAKGVMYAVGVEHKRGQFGMTHGPVPDLHAMLAVEPPAHGVIFRFQGPSQPEEIVATAKIDPNNETRSWMAVEGKL